MFGTCAGLILLADEVLDGRPDQRCFGVIDLTVRRNGYGRQVASFECDLEVDGLGGEAGPRRVHPGPGGRAAGPGVEVLARLPAGRSGPGRPRTGSEPVVCRQGSVLVTLVPPRVDRGP